MSEINIHICKDCSNGEYHGFKPKYASTVYFWCPINKHHDSYQDATDCKHFKPGKPKCFDNRGNEVDLDITW